MSKKLTNEEFDKKLLKFNPEIKRVEDAVSLKEPDRIPIVPMLGALPYFLDGTTYKDSMYNYETSMF